MSVAALFIDGAYLEKVLPYDQTKRRLTLDALLASWSRALSCFVRTTTLPSVPKQSTNRWRERDTRSGIDP